MADDSDEEEVGKKKVSTRKVHLHQVLAPNNMCELAVEKLDEAIDNHTIEKDMATAVKTTFDKDYGGTWHCIVGKSFGCSITHETKYLMYIQVDHLFCLLFCSDTPNIKKQVPEKKEKK